MSEDLTFGNWLRRRRKELSITQEELAARLDISWITLRKLESGERHPSGQIALLLADHLRVPSDERHAFVAFARTGRQPQGDVSPVAPWRSTFVQQTNLPILLAPIIGRDKEVAAAYDHLLNPKTRLLTLTGAPGIGKTRLGLQAALELLPNFEDGVYFVDLSPVTDPDLVLTEVARTLRLKETGGESIEETLSGYLKGRKIMLVLDNFEHLLDAAPTMVKLLWESPWLKLLATSREPLHVRGERRYPVQPLAFPDTKVSIDLRTLLSYPSVELFVDRAQEVAPHFELGEDNIEDVAAVVAGLEGLPLAIELAAARIDWLTPREMRAALVSRLELGKEGARDLPPRQRTLRASIEWSYNLLDDDEQALFRRLGTFSRTFTADAVSVLFEEGASDLPGSRSVLREAQARGVLSALASKNLIRLHRHESGEDRYQLLEAIREYAQQRLAMSGIEGAIRLLHARYFTVHAEETNAGRRGPEKLMLLNRLEAEYSNALAALHWLLNRARESDDAGLAELSVRMTIALYYYWDLRGYFSEGRECQAMALALGKRLLWRSALEPGNEGGARLLKMHAQLMNGAGLLAWNQGDLDAARSYFNACIPIMQRLDNKPGLSVVYNNIANLDSEQGKYEQAIEVYKQMLRTEREITATSHIALMLNNLGVAYWNSGDAANARAMYEESLALYRQTDDPDGTVLALDNLGMVVAHDGDYEAARRYQEEALSICRTLGNKNNLAHVLANTAGRSVGDGDYVAARGYFRELLPLLQDQGYQRVIVKCVEGLADLSHGEERPLEAARFWGIAEAMREAAKYPIARTGIENYRRNVDSARASANPGDFQSAWTEGRAMSGQEVLAYALDYLGR